MQIAYVDGPRFRRSIVAACGYADQGRAELNRIDVFPVWGLAWTVDEPETENEERGVAAGGRSR